MSGVQASAGWYPDPYVDGGLIWWDGEAWGPRTPPSLPPLAEELDTSAGLREVHAALLKVVDRGAGAAPEDGSFPEAAALIGSVEESQPVEETVNATVRRGPLNTKWWTWWKISIAVPLFLSLATLAFVLAWQFFGPGSSETSSSAVATTTSGGLTSRLLYKGCSENPMDSSVGCFLTIDVVNEKSSPVQVNGIPYAVADGKTYADGGGNNLMSTLNPGQHGTFQAAFAFPNGSRVTSIWVGYQGLDPVLTLDTNFVAKPDPSSSSGA
jgi:hypothetical protein